MSEQPIPVAIIAGQLVVGGAERQLYLWLSHLDLKKYQPIVLTLHPGCDDYWETPIEALNIPLFRIPRRHNRIQRLADIVKVLSPYKPKLIHGWHLFASPYAGAAAKLLGVKSLGSLRSSFRTLLNTPLETMLMFLFVDGILANSRSAAEKLHSICKRKEQSFFAVQNAVVDREFSEQKVIRERLKKQFNVPQTGILIGSLGRLVPKKRFDLLLRVVALLRENLTDFHFLLIGDGPEKARLVKMADILGITSYVTFAGEIPGGDGWLKALDIFCFTSLDEGLPNAVMEASLAGLPIVAWRAPFMQELLKNGDIALLAEPEDLGDFTHKLVLLAGSTEMRSQYGQAARAHMLAQFGTERFVQGMTDVYDEILGRRTQTPSGSI